MARCVDLGRQTSRHRRSGSDARRLGPELPLLEGLRPALCGTEGGSPTAPTLTQKALTVFDSTGSPSGIDSGNVTWGVALADGKNVVPNVVSSDYAVQLYKYPAGGAPVAGWNVPGSAVTPAFATISR